uniref:Uncharacterized protein n=1 Tax=Arundo donax TaxID=35708 RepID=A0A0A9FG53_ARUDO
MFFFVFSCCGSMLLQCLFCNISISAEARRLSFDYDSTHSYIG